MKTKTKLMICDISVTSAVIAKIYQLYKTGSVGYYVLGCMGVPTYFIAICGIALVSPVVLPLYSKGRKVAIDMFDEENSLSDRIKEITNGLNK